MKLTTYCIENDTDMYAIVLDEEFQLFQTEAEVAAIRAEIFRNAGGSHHIQDTAFNFYEILPPHSGKGQRLSECEPTDLMAYMATRRAEINAKPDPVYDFQGFFGGMLQ